jgi:hypothetical protein
MVRRRRAFDDNSKNMNDPTVQDLVENAQIAYPEVPLRLHEVRQSLPQALAVSSLNLGVLDQVADRGADPSSPERG